MNVSELLTYIEELSFKTSMLGYDKDDVDIQLDKICDEIEAIVSEKDKEIADLKSNGLVIHTSSEPEPIAEPVVKPEPSVVPTTVASAQAAMEIKKLQNDLAAAEARCRLATDKAAGAEELINAAKAEASEAAAKLAEKDAQIAALEQELAEVKAALENAEAVLAEYDEYEEDEEEAVVETVEEAVEEAAVIEEVKEAAPEIPATKDAAYEQYLRNADLLCQQLSLVQAQQDSLLANAKAEAEQLVADAEANAAQILADAQAKSDQTLEDSKSALAQQEALCKELADKKAYLTSSLKDLTADIQRLIAKASN